MLGDAEVIGAAEAVVDAYLVGLLYPPAAPAAAASSQTPHRRRPTSGERKQQLPQPHEAQRASAEGHLSVLRRSAQALYVLACVVDMVYQGLTCTERDVYYRNTLLFPNGQRDVHTSIEHLCRWMDSARPLPAHPAATGADYPVGAGQRGYTREGLHIYASGKSLLMGYISFDVPTAAAFPASAAHAMHLAERTVPQAQGDSKQPATPSMGTVEVNGMRHASGILLDMAVGMRGCHFRGAGGPGSSPAAVILLEKESTLRTLVEANGALGLGAPLSRCVFLCSKGYPCRASRALLRRLHRELPKLPIFVLVDGDPHGMRIALTFMGLFGEDAAARRRRRPLPPRQQAPPAPEKNFLSALLPARWIGVRPSALPHEATGRAPLTPSDRRVLLHLMARVVEAISHLGDDVGGAGRGAEDVSLIRGSLTDLLREAEWMTEKSLKCALQAWPDGPMRLLSASLALGRLV
ncbi:meiosis recombination protein SPO11 [Trypanosoma conorhini]|uniref:DNA topoisomerase (ATP-hydrolyzing) n=1 Tax=Trypanosoma conorhini TaxID=83891 RepID=A0A3R7PNW7_9TRYP|nr:meiosis recombination protein SPO11 [Trypanosoma conorhini]RNF22904.1 meiosis recombination protein SPO11 [Trypanosoma conorhini]